MAPDIAAAIATFASGLSPERTLIELSGMFPTQVICAYAMSRILPLRYPRAYWGITLGALAVLALCRWMLPDALRITLGIALSALTVVLTEGALLRRVIIGTIGYVVLVFCDLPFCAMWILVTGFPTMDYEVAYGLYPEFLWLSGVHLIILVLLLVLLKVAVDRLLPPRPRRVGEGSSVRAGGRSATHADERSSEAAGAEAAPWLAPFAWFPAMQLLLISFSLQYSVVLSQGSSVLVAANLVIAFLCFAADALMLFAIDRCRHRRRAEGRSRALERQVDAYCVDQRAVVDLLEDAARLRHDVRNQVQVVGMLSERGDYERAREHLQALRREL